MTSPNITLRLPDDLHRRICSMAALCHLSVNKYVVELLTASTTGEAPPDQTKTTGLTLPTNRLLTDEPPRTEAAQEDYAARSTAYAAARTAEAAKTVETHLTNQIEALEATRAALRVAMANAAHYANGRSVPT